MKADEVAQKAFDGIRHGSFFISCNMEGIALSLATSGLSPQRSFLMAFVEVITAGILRIAALCFQWNWYGSIEKWHKERKCKSLFTFWKHFQFFILKISCIEQLWHREDGRLVRDNKFLETMKTIFRIFKVSIKTDIFSKAKKENDEKNTVSVFSKKLLLMWECILDVSP